MSLFTVTRLRAATLRRALGLPWVLALCAGASARSTPFAEPSHGSAEVELTVEHLAHSTRLTLESDISGRYAILAFDPVAVPRAPRVALVGWHAADRASIVELHLCPALRATLALQAVVVPLGAARACARTSSWISLGQSQTAVTSAGTAASLPLVIPMRVRSCALDCTSGPTPSSQITCGVLNVFVNADVRFRFTLPVELSSITPNTFQINNTATGAVPAGTFRTEPTDPRTLIFRPALSFDALGNPVFGLQSGATYRLAMPGFAQGDPPPYLMSTTALLNQNRVQCNVTADQGVADYVPGAPRVAITVEVVTSYDPQTGLPNGFANVAAAGASNVWTDSVITFDFDDVMHAATLLVPASGALPFIRVLVDADGDLTTVADQTPQPGTATFSLDLDGRTCRMVFDPSPSLPHSGSGATTSRIVVDVPSAVKDIAGNAVSNAGVISFQTEP